MEQFQQNPRILIDVAAQMCSAEGFWEAASLLQDCSPTLDLVDFDNWNGGTHYWAIRLYVAPRTFVRIKGERETLVQQIAGQIEEITRPYLNHSFFTEIVPAIASAANAADQDHVLAETRSQILDYLSTIQFGWSGRLSEVDFLKRTFDLDHMPSTDDRFENATGDIWKHRVDCPNDWPGDWVFSDSRFDFLNVPRDVFLRFICEMLHPVVRPDRDEARHAASSLNQLLRSDGWMLVEGDEIAGGRKYDARRFSVGGGMLAARSRSVATALDSTRLRQEVERMERSVEADPALAIGTAKELVESCCKSILAQRNVAFSSKADLPELTKLLARELELVPEGISDEARGADTIRLILRNLAALSQYLAELRGLYGTGHGRDGKHRGLLPRHARLAVGVAVTFADFVTETHLQRPARAVEHPEH